MLDDLDMPVRAARRPYARFWNKRREAELVSVWTAKPDFATAAAHFGVTEGAIRARVERMRARGIPLPFKHTTHPSAPKRFRGVTRG